MSGLGHFIEAQGIPTAGISLVREHSVAARPPRALWVPFDFGHPFGAAHRPGEQRQVLLELLALFESIDGPMLRDYSDAAANDEASGADTAAPWSCPIGLIGQSSHEESDSDVPLEQAVKEEFRQLIPWYEHAAAERGRTTVGGSGIDTGNLVEFIAGFLLAPNPDNPNEDLPLALVLKAAVEDLKQLYLEAASVQPGEPHPTPAQLNEWFWRDTRAADLVRSVSNSAKASDDQTLRTVAGYLLVPLAHT